MVPLALHLDRVQKGGVRSVPVVEAEIGEGPRAPVVVAAPEQGESRVHVRAAGFVEKMLVSEVGTSVAAGQTLALVYAPEVYRAQEEYLAARRWHEADGGPGPELDPARRRLELLGLTRGDIEAIDQAGTPTRALPLRAPAGGQILRREIALGAHVSPEQMLYEIADLSRVYLVADVLTADLSRVKLGASAPVSFGPAGEVEAVVDLIYPEINAATRTTRVRLRPKTRLAGLRPGLYGELSLPAAHRRGLVVPRDAIIDTGRSVHVFVDQGDGHFMPRPVTIGTAIGDRVEVREGLAKGDLVVSGAAFLLDAESRLSAALTGLDAPPAASSAGAPTRPPAAPAASSAGASSPRPAGSP
jgi:Cu(I)/Ag(I) efflux system membrane fusion protein